MFDPFGEVAFFSKMHAFKLKEDIRVYTGEDMRVELLAIHARKIIDFSATYDITDSTTREKIGALRRQGFKSMIRDRWSLLDPQDQEYGFIEEDTETMAMVRRFLTALVPQTFYAIIHGNMVAEYTQNFNPFLFKMTCDFSMDAKWLLDRRMGIAAAVLLSAVERRQQTY